jgi:methylated-DNA-[protein]-cysteine S-methyltransferase
MYFTHVPSAFGEISLVWYIAEPVPVVHRIFLSRGIVPSHQAALASYPAAVVAHHPAMDALTEQLQRTLAGETQTFDLACVALDACTPFQRRVLLAEYAIPRGSVATYGRIAAHLDVQGGARAVGNALSTNPFPLVIPCHRAVRANATLGGYQGGSMMKRALLEYEGHSFTPQGRLADPRYHY